MENLEKKILEHEMLEKAKGEIRRTMAIYSAAFTLVFGVLSFIGFQSIRDSFFDSEYAKKIKSDVYLELQENIGSLESKLASTNRLENQYKTLLSDFDKKSEELNKLYELTKKLSVNYDMLTKLVSKDVITKISDDRTYDIMRAFGVSPQIFFEILLNETDIKIDEFYKGKYEESISFIQHKYGLSIDGKVGPCTALLFSALSLSIQDNNSKTNLRKSVFREHPELSWVISACSRDDKRAILWIMEQNDNLKINMYSAIDNIGLDLINVTSLLNSDIADSKAYAALRTIHELVGKNENN